MDFLRYEVSDRNAAAWHNIWSVPDPRVQTHDQHSVANITDTLLNGTTYKHVANKAKVDRGSWRPQTQLQRDHEDGTHTYSVTVHDADERYCFKK